MAQATLSGVSIEATPESRSSNPAAGPVAIVSSDQAERHNVKSTACTASEGARSGSDVAGKAEENPRPRDEATISSALNISGSVEAGSDGLKALSEPLSEMMSALSLVVEGELQANTVPSYQRLTHLNLEAAADGERLADLTVGVGVFVRCQLAARAATLRQLVAEAEEAERQLADLEGVVAELDKFTGKLERAVAKAIREGV
ncbi:hypothetical protein CLOM_g14835 [Closterium sp. NIES-68]|nr:hypothetical protein CLOM_g22766 [Closterium sp. NIES-68]GJP55807.1 hypothetical protein CLOM_g14835 [Closterium sp. NIES-68]